MADHREPQAPLAAEIESAVRASFARQSLMSTLGAEMTLLRTGLCEIGFSRRDHLLQQHGYLHAGVATAIVDSACGYAALGLAPSGSEVLTIEFKVNFLRPAAGVSFLARGKVLKPGRQIMVCEGEVFEAANDADARLVAKMSASLIVQKA